MIVYKHTAPNGKVYIGITSHSIEWRSKKDGSGYKGNDYFWKAIQKYGWNNFKHEILFDGLTKEEAIQKEIEMITQYKSNDSKFGYNHTLGGEGHLGCHFSEETCQKISASLKGKPLSEEHKRKISKGVKKNPPHYWRDKHHSEETRKKISESLKGVNHPRFNKHLSEEHRRKISESLKRKENVS